MCPQLDGVKPYTTTITAATLVLFTLHLTNTNTLLHNLSLDKFNRGILTNERTGTYHVIVYSSPTGNGPCEACRVKLAAISEGRHSRDSNLLPLEYLGQLSCVSQCSFTQLEIFLTNKAEPVT